MAPQTCTLAGLNTLSMIFHIQFCAKYDNGVDFYDCEIQTNVNALCVQRRDIFNIHIQKLSDYTLILFIETKWHDDLITCMVKHGPLIYLKKCEKTFEILRS